MCELLWSDPGPTNGRTPSKRGVGVAFGADVTQRFLQDNGLELLVRSHEVPPPHTLLLDTHSGSGIHAHAASQTSTSPATA